MAYIVLIYTCSKSNLKIYFVGKKKEELLKKFSILIVTILIVSAVLATGCTAQTPQKVCDSVIPVEGLKAYSGKDVTIEGSFNNLTMLKIEGKNVCASSNGLYVENKGQSGPEVLFKLKSANGEIGGANDFLGFSDANVYVGLTGKLYFLLQPEILIDSVLTESGNLTCTMLDEKNINSLNGQTVKIVGSYVDESDMFGDQYLVFTTVSGKPYCYANGLGVYKTVDVFGKPHHVEFESDLFDRPELLFGTEGVLSVEKASDGFPDVYIDAGAGKREDSVDPMVEEIGSHNPELDYLQYPGYFGETLTDGKGSIYSLMLVDMPPVLKPGYQISPKSYTYGGKVDLNSEVGKIDGQSLVLTSVANCEKEGNGPYEAEFHFNLGGKEVAAPYQTQGYIALIKGDGANQDLVYYQVDTSDFCK
jgi:hypothetical protein